MNKREKIKKGICPKCGDELIKTQVKARNLMWQHKMTCLCGYNLCGTGVPNNKLNPYYFSRRSFKVLQRRLGELGFGNYKEYLKSNHWKSLKRRYLKPCFVCRARAELHHRTYVNLGKEKRRDFVSLCRKHHFYTHFEFNKSAI